MLRERERELEIEKERNNVREALISYLPYVPQMGFEAAT